MPPSPESLLQSIDLAGVIWVAMGWYVLFLAAVFGLFGLFAVAYHWVDAPPRPARRRAPRHHGHGLGWPLGGGAH